MGKIIYDDLTDVVMTKASSVKIIKLTNIHRIAFNFYMIII